MLELTKIEEILIIGIWRLQDQAYGYKIRKYISEIIQKDFTYGNLYSALSQLVKKGYIIKKTEDQDDQKQGKKRIYYSVSPKGIQALNNSHDVHTILWDGITGFALDRET